MNRALIGAGLLLSTVVSGVASSAPKPFEAAASEEARRDGQPAQPPKARIDEAESAAIGVLRTLNSAEAAYSKANKDVYASLAELIKGSFVDPSVQKGKNGYTFEIHVTANKTDYLAVATPTEMRGAMIMFSGTEGVIRYGSGTSTGERVK